MKKFNIGDRVTFTGKYEARTEFKNGDSGTIIDEDTYSYCVQLVGTLAGTPGTGFSKMIKREKAGIAGGLQSTTIN